MFSIFLFISLLLYAHVYSLLTFPKKHEWKKTCKTWIICDIPYLTLFLGHFTCFGDQQMDRQSDRQTDPQIDQCVAFFPRNQSLVAGALLSDGAFSRSDSNWRFFVFL